MNDALLPSKRPKTSKSNTRGSSGVQYIVKVSFLDINNDGENGRMPFREQISSNIKAAEGGEASMVPPGYLLSYAIDALLSPYFLPADFVTVDYSSSLGPACASIFTASFGYLVCPMSDAHSFLDDNVRASISRAFISAPLDLRTMPHAHSTSPGLVFTSVAAALFDLRSMSDTHTSLDYSVCASVATASFGLCPVPDAHSTSPDLVCTSIATASFGLCPVPDAHSSFLSKI